MDWISKLPSNKKFNDIMIPGSHNSGSYALTSKLDPNRKDLSNLKVLNFFFPCCIKDFSTCQNFNLVEQFKNGVRYFDIRLTNIDKSIYFTHGLVGKLFLPELQKLLDYTQNHPKEIFILDFRLFYGFTAETHDSFQTTLNDIIKTRLATELRPYSTLSQFWNSNKNVIVMYSYNLPLSNFWAKSDITSQWANTADLNTAMTFIRDELNKARDKNKFFCIQGILTPTETYIKSHPFSSTLELSQKIKPQIKKNLSTWSPFNILIYDFVDSLSKDIYSLNNLF